MTRPRVRRHGSQKLFDGGFAYSAEVSDATMLYTAGVSPLDSDGAVVGPDDPVAQVTHAFRLLSVLLDERGAAIDDIVKLTVYIATSQRADLAAVWEALAPEFGGEIPPAVIVSVTVLPYPGQRVELDAVAALRGSGLP
ncbi:RidA family protein [Gordonia sp. HY002]|uniref:RidA family protein n=1 Tax=Gordonia zhenghanii TaxID=2911516 RepID=UPI001EF0B84B|nr:RidA family protein [Gordonia zhenghanii]MCF8569016.1 RidA family protein [Gordonia zhenghanii]MCF8606340.1 RidA family protein [Gordonia zhenghanii]